MDIVTLKTKVSDVLKLANDKYFSIVCVAAFMLTAMPVQSYADITTGLVGWWKFEEGTGTATTQDSSGQGNAGTLTGHAPSWVSRCPRNNCLSFDGTSSKYVSIASSFGLTNANMTAAVWTYIAAVGDRGAFFKIGNNTDPTGGDGFAFGIGGAGSSGFEAAGSNILVLYEGVRWIDTGVSSTAGWHHFALVINSSGAPTLYRDGISIYSDAGAAPTTIGSLGASITQIGGYTASNSANRFFTGYIDDVRVYSRALLASEVYTLYIGGSKIANGKINRVEMKN